MSEDNPPSTNGSSNKGWIEKIVQSFTGEPKNKEELFGIITDAEQRKVINPQTKAMIEGVMEVSKMRVREIMIPRAQMRTIEIDQSVEEFLPILLESAHSRFPVISEDKDHIEGILLAKDLLEYAFVPGKEFELKNILRPAVIVPESKKVDVLLKEFQQKRYHMAIVVDEYGGVSGLVTIEDILELIVGEIEDEHDDEHVPLMAQLENGSWEVDARAELDDVGKEIDPALEMIDEDVDTIGGLSFVLAGHIPTVGEVLEHPSGWKLKVLEADDRRVTKLRLHPPKDQN